MGVDFRAYAVLGVSFVLDRNPVEVRIRGCGHEGVPEGKFCSECGAPAWKVESVTPTFESFFDAMENLRDPYVFVSQDFEWEAKYRRGPAMQECIFGVGTSVYGERGFQYSSSLDVYDKREVLHRIQDVLEPLGMWNSELESSFGLHAVLTAS